MQQVYADGQDSYYVYTDERRLDAEFHNGPLTFLYHYNTQGQLARVEDFENDIIWQYCYDYAGRPISGGNSKGLDYRYSYDARGKPISTTGTLASTIGFNPDDPFETPIISRQLPTPQAVHRCLRRCSRNDAVLSAYTSKSRGEIHNTARRLRCADQNDESPPERAQKEAA